MRQKSPFNPALKAWLDNVIVPVLVQEYLAEMRLEKKFASDTEGELESTARTDPSPEGRP